MKIVYIENVRMPSERAHAYQIAQTCAAWSRAGHTVVLVNPSRARGQSLFDYFHLPDQLFQHITLPVFDLLQWSWIPRPLAYFIQRWSFLRATRRWMKTVPDVDVWYTRDVAMVAGLGASDRRFVLELHDAPERLHKRWKLLQPLIRGFVTITKTMLPKLKELGVPDVCTFVAPDGFDPEEFRSLSTREDARKELGIPADAFVAFYLGGLFAWKGIDLVVASWAQTLTRAHLIVIGGPKQDRERLEALVPLNLKARVHFFDQTPHQKAIRLFSSADIGLLTSSPKEDHGRLYTSPLKQFEYLAAGLPILASDVPSSHEILDETVARFYQPSVEGFVSVLHFVMQNPAWLSQSASRARTFVQPYSWQTRSEGVVRWLEASHC